MNRGQNSPSLKNDKAPPTELRLQIQTLQSMFENMPWGVLIAHDPESRVVTGNKYTQNFFGTSPGDNVSVRSRGPKRPTVRFIQDGRELPDEALTLPKAVLEGTVVVNQELDVEMINGSLHTILASAAPFYDVEGKIRGGISFWTDITDRRREERERERVLAETEKRRHEAEDANRAKDEFLSMLSHELRSPLQGILGWVQLLQRRQVEPERLQRALDIIERNIKMQSYLINDMLETSRFIAGKFQIEKQPIDLVELVESATEEMRPWADSKSIEIECKIEDIPPVVGDIERLHQVMANVLSNAVKFTGEGGGIDVRCRRDGGWALITVADNGEGIPPEFMPRIFDRFSQADCGMSRRHGGLGLGLAIARHIVELHSGSMQAESEGLGKGSRFHVRIPLALRDRAKSVAAHKTDKKRELPTLDGVKILLVEDSEDSREVLELVLQHQRACVRAVGSAQEAIKALRRELPDIIVSDLSMPDEDGFSLIKKIRSSEKTRRIPAIALTGHAGAEDRERVLAAGFQAHAAKPIQIETLVRDILELVST